MAGVKWETNVRKYSSGENAKLGKFIVGEVFYDSATSKSDDKKYAATCFLPGIRKNLGNYQITVK